MSRDQETSKRAARVLIVDDHPAVREALSIRISTQTGLNVCGEAADVPQALRLVEATDPDVAVVDVALKTGDGIDLIRRIRTRNQRVRMLVWSMYSENLYAERALRAGAMGYINKDQATTTIIEAIRQVLGGKVFLSAAMTEKLLRRSVGQDPSRLPIDTLSDRELEVFRLIGQGVKTHDIATRLHLSTKTVETYRDRIRGKMDLSDGEELSRTAFQWMIENGGGGSGAEPNKGIS
jgi:DNA-binding NarL/FixJ family response regulator